MIPNARGTWSTLLRGSVADANGEVEFLADEIDAPIGEVEVDPHLGMPRQERGQARRHFEVAEGHRRGETDLPARLRQ